MSPFWSRLLLALFCAASLLAGAASAHAAEQPARPVEIKVVHRAPGAADDYRLIVDAPVEASGDLTPNKAVGWWDKYSSAPAPDKWSFYIAHKTPSADGKTVTAPFQNLDQTKAGDEIWIKLDNGLSATYIVTESVVLLNADAWPKVTSEMTPGTITLYGCEKTKIWQSPSGERRTTDVRPGPSWKLVDRTHKRVVRAKLVGIW